MNPSTQISEEQLLKILSSFKNRKIAVLGDVGIDRYTIGSVERISPEAPVPIDGTTFASVELVEATGDDAFHDGNFVLVHRIEVVGAAGFDRRQYLVSGELREGEEWSGDGFTVRVLTMGDGRARIEFSEDA